MIRLEVDADHRAEFEIDEKNQDIRDRCLASRSHIEERERGRPYDRTADRKQREIVERVDQEIADTGRDSLELCIQGIGLRWLHHVSPSNSVKVFLSGFGSTLETSRSIRLCARPPGS